MQQVKHTNVLGSLIKDTRKQQQLTQSELAAVCGVGVRFVRELEHGKISCHIGKVLQVLHMLGLDIFIATRGEL